MEPFYDDGMVAIYHADCREILPTIGPIGLLLSDPPYGIRYRSNHNSSRRGQWAKWVRYENLPGIVGDERPIDTAPLLALGAPTALFGSNYMADQLPPSRCWIIWNKRDGIGQNNQADCEMVWTNFNRPSRIYNHLWSGLLRAGEENVSRSQKTHPHQKPLALLRYIIRYSETGGIIVDPYAGSCSTAVAAKQLGRRSIVIEIEERYCEIGARRCSQEIIQFDNQ